MIAYDKALALELCEHSVAEYGLSNTYGRWARARGFVGADSIDRGSTQIGVAYDDERIVISARGTSQTLDWLDDFLPFRITWSPFVDGRIHFGVRLQMRRALDDLLDTVRSMMVAKLRKIYITGHSLGAALASLIRCVLEHDGFRIEAVYTFESPRVGNKKWGDWYDAGYRSNSFRVVNINEGEQDIVTRVPLSRFGWCHVGRPVILSGGTAYESEAMWEAERRKNPVGVLSHFRIVRSARLSVNAHLGTYLLTELRAQIALQQGMINA